jgi:hypothetical protein
MPQVAPKRGENSVGAATQGRPYMPPSYFTTDGYLLIIEERISVRSASAQLSYR